MSVDDLKQLVGTLRELGVTRYRSEGVEIELGAPPAPPPRAMTDAEVKELLGPEPTPEDLLHWSTSGPLPSETKYTPPEE